MQGDQGDDNIFLVVEMAQQGRGDNDQDVRQPVGLVGSSGGLAADGLMKAHTGLKQGLQMGVDGVVITVQQVEARDDARFDPAHGRKIVAGLDAVMAVQMLQKGLQGRDQGAVQAGGIECALAPLLRQPGHMRLMVTETGMHLQPVGRGRVQGGGPPVARKGFTQIKQIGGQARAVGQRLAGCLRQPQW